MAPGRRTPIAAARSAGLVNSEVGWTNDDRGRRVQGGDAVTGILSRMESLREGGVNDRPEILVDKQTEGS